MALRVVGVLTEKASARVGESVEWTIGKQGGPGKRMSDPASPIGALLIDAHVGDEITVPGCDNDGLDEYPIRVTEVKML